MGPQTKHQEIREWLLAEVVATMAPDDMLPTERRLSERFGVSRMTVQQALNGLRADGILHAVRGVGTFVARPRLSKGPALTSFSEDLKARGYVPTTRLIAAEELEAETHVAVELGVPPAPGCIGSSGCGSPTGARCATRRCTCTPRASPAC